MLSEIDPPSSPDSIELVTDLVAAYVSKNSVPVSALPELIATAHAALAGLGRPVAEPAADKATPAQVRKSIQPDGLVSFIDGRSYKTLRRHITTHGFTPETYRSRYGLPVDYPLTAASYSEVRSALAKGVGLGRRRSTEAAELVPAAEPIADAPAAPKRRGRAPKARAEA